MCRGTVDRLHCICILQFHTTPITKTKCSELYLQPTFVLCRFLIACISWVIIILFMYYFNFCKGLIHYILDMPYLSHRTSEFCTVGKCAIYFHSRFHILASVFRYYRNQIENNQILWQPPSCYFFTPRSFTTNYFRTLM